MKTIFSRTSLAVKFVFAALISMFVCYSLGVCYLAPYLLLGALLIPQAKGVFNITLLGTPITFNGEEARQGILGAAYERPALQLFHTIVEDVVAKTQIAFLARTNKVTKKDDGCGTGQTNKSLQMTEKFWNPAKLKVWVQQCADDLEGTFYVWGLNKGIARKDLTQTDFMVYIMEIMSDAVADDILRMAWFGDTALLNVADGGVLVNASDPGDYTPFDGFWKQIFAELASGNHYTITENALSTTAAQDALASDAAIKAFRAILSSNADPRLKSNPNKVIICTTSLYENWLTFKETGQFDRSFERQAQGFQTDVYRGVPIYAFDLWDRWIRADFTDGTKNYLPHRAVCTTKEMLQIGFDSSASLNNWRAYFDDTTELNNLKGGYKADTKIIFPYMFAAAY